MPQGLRALRPSNWEKTMVISTVIDLLEWFAAFFLAIEAIKLQNLASLRMRLTGTIYLGKDFFTGGYGRKYDYVIILIAGAVATYFLFRALKLHPALLSQNWEELVKTWRSPIHIIVAFWMEFFRVLGFLALTWIVGVAIMALPPVILVVTVIAMEWVEENTASGVTGIIGFALFSLATFLKLIQDH